MWNCNRVTTFTFVLLVSYAIVAATVANPIDWKEHSEDPPQTHIYEDVRRNYHVPLGLGEYPLFDSPIRKDTHDVPTGIGKGGSIIDQTRLIRLVRSLQPGGLQFPIELMKKIPTPRPGPKKYF